MPTYTPIQSIVLTSSTNSVTFSGIPQNYQDLVLIYSAKVSSGFDVWIRCNGDTGSNYSYTSLWGNGTTSSSNRDTNKTEGLLVDYYGTPTSDFGQISICHFLNYSNTTTYKNMLTRSSRAGSGTDANIALWRSTSAITSLTLKESTGSKTFDAGSTFDLYGISPVAAQTAQAFGGTEIYYDSSYVYHVFKGSGTFTPYRNLTVDYLVVAGGGGGSATYGFAGGGAGGLRSTVTTTGGGGGLPSALSLTANTAYTVTVGAGGHGSILTEQGPGGSGSSSTFSTVSTTGGGGGGGNDANGLSGGSGGGGGATSVANRSGGTGTTNEGYAGGNNYPGGNGVRAGGSGGGAGVVGTNASSGKGGNGGNGVQITAFATITGTGANSGYYAGGGAGGSLIGTPGSGGLGGGGNANSNGQGNPGITNTGSGGAGGDYQSGDNKAAGNGGSGIVILRYAR